MEQDKHIVKSYDDEMKEINNNILDIGSLVENQLKRALNALKNQDTALAEKVIEDDNIIDEKFRELDQNLVLILGKRQPMATDLRTIFSAIKISAFSLSTILSTVPIMPAEVITLSPLLRFSTIILCSLTFFC